MVKGQPSIKGPILLMILDGWGIRKEKRLNAPAIAATPNFDRLFKKNPHSSLKASGKDVGVPRGFQGNSEVGHLNIGAGRIVFEDIEKVNDSIKDKSFFDNSALMKAINNCKKKNSVLHLMGLIQREGVHAMSDHLVALLKFAKMNGLKKVYIHAFTDGRDTPPKSAGTHLKFVQDSIDRLGVGEIKTVIGRYYAMDRDERWQRTKLAYDCLVLGKGVKVKNWRSALRESYAKKQTDEFIKPKVIGDFNGIENDDSILFFNYRLDRARQLTKAFIEPAFRKFKRAKKRVEYVCMTHYYTGVDKYSSVVIEEMEMKNILGEVLAKKRIRQLRIAETEKYAHVTFFFNSLKDDPFPYEDRILVHSPRDVPTYDKKPEMSVYKITSRLLKDIDTEKHKVIILNYANGDMVGHTGIIGAAVKAVEAVDECIGKVVNKVLEKKGVVFITADHGNCEDMSGKTKTSHTINPVPCILVGHPADVKMRNGRLADIAPTILDMLRVKKPKEMTGESLIVRK